MNINMGFSVVFPTPEIELEIRKYCHAYKAVLSILTVENWVLQPVIVSDSPIVPQ